MQLKWRIFLVSLVLIMLAVSGSTMAVLHISMSDRIEALIDQSVQDHAQLAQSLQNRAAYERLQNDLPLLTSERLATVATLSLNSRMAQRAGSALCGAAVTVNVDSQYGALPIQFGEDIDEERLPETDDMEYGKCYSCIYDTGSVWRLAVGSHLILEEGVLTLYSVYDIDETFTGYNSNLFLVWLVGIGFSLVISIILFAVTSSLLQPLTRVNEALGRIAGGNYSERVERRGGVSEITEITDNINAMAGAVESNVEKLESIADGRKRYVNSLAHEMKTPLTSILCFGDLLRIKRNVSDGERLEYAGVIVDEAKRMKNLSSKLLELACADSAELDMEKTSVTELLSEAHTVIAPALEARGIALDFKGEDGYIKCDRELFKSLIYNLCDNAAKASEAGQSVHIRSRAAENGMVISISDHGIGMTKEVLKKVTEPFYMADKSRSRKAGGAGLGLSLCVEIAKRHSARITAKSKPGVGTTIYITVPYWTDDAAKEGNS